MRVMGLDLSTHAGVAVLDTKAMAVVHASEVSYPKLTGGPRINAIAGQIMDIKEATNPDIILVEDYAVGRFAGSAIVSIELGSVIRFLLWQMDFPYLPVAPTALKKFVTGKGNAQKNTMLLEVYKRWNYTAATDNVADAIGLAHFGACLMKSGWVYTKAQEECATAGLTHASERFHKAHKQFNLQLMSK